MPTKKGGQTESCVITKCGDTGLGKGGGWCTGRESHRKGNLPKKTMPPLPLAFRVLPKVCQEFKLIFFLKSKLAKDSQS